MLLCEIENARGRQRRQAMRTRLCGGIPADLSFCYFLIKQKVEEEIIDCTFFLEKKSTKKYKAHLKSTRSTIHARPLH